MCCGHCANRRDWYGPARGDGVDRLISLTRVFGPRRRGRQPRTPPPIAVGEITSSNRRDVGALELITRFNARRRRGQAPSPGGLAWYTPTGLVRYAVADPAQQRLLWQGNIGRIPNIGAMGEAQREAAIRQLISARTGQRFRNLAPGHAGPDLVPAFDEADDFDDPLFDEADEYAEELEAFYA